MLAVVWAQSVSDRKPTRGSDRTFNGRATRYLYNRESQAFAIGGERARGFRVRVSGATPPDPWIARHRGSGVRPTCAPGDYVVVVVLVLVVVGAEVVGGAFVVVVELELVVGAELCVTVWVWLV